MADQSTGTHIPFIVYYEEPGSKKKFELTEWAKRRLNPNPPYTERIRRITVEKWDNIKTKLKTLLQNH